MCSDEKRMCKKCYGGFELVNGECEICTGLTYSEGLECLPMENCVLAKPGSPYYDCLKCAVGYGVDYRNCTKCTGNTYSDDGYGCKPGPEHCAEAGNHTVFTCTACEDAYDLIDGACLYHVEPPFFLLIVMGLFIVIAVVLLIMKLACKKDMRKVLRPYQRKVSYYTQLGVSKIMKRADEKKQQKAKEKERKAKEEEEENENGVDVKTIVKVDIDDNESFDSESD